VEATGRHRPGTLTDAKQSVSPDDLVNAEQTGDNMIDTAATATRTAGSLAGQTVVVIGGSSGMGLQVAHQAKAAGASLILTGRDAARLDQAAREVGAVSTGELDLGHPEQLDRFFVGLPATIDHVFVTGSGPPYAPIAELDFDQVRRALDEHLTGSLRIAKVCAGRVRAGGSLTLITGTYARRPGIGLVVAAIEAVAVPAIVANIAIELAPMRANAIAAGFVDTPLSSRLLGDDIEHRREELRATLPIRRVVGPADVAALVIQLMTNTAVTGATFDIDGGQSLIP
jgi:NAD(P)-dependent dehydrogenase (short-subunit alcohol dehydrogenase family)